MNASGSGKGGGSSSGPTGDMGLFDDPVGFLNGGTQGPFGQMLKSALSGPGLQNYYDPNRSFAQNALDPRGIEQAMNIGAGFAMPIKAYHGSPYDFTKFDASKIGTGQKAQSFGHGLYFAEHPAVAQSYRDELAGYDFSKTKSGAPISSDLSRVLQEGYDAAASQGIRGPSFNDAMFMARQNLERQNADALKAGDMDWYKRIADQSAELHRVSKDVPSPSGKMYEVNINAEPDQFLNWDKPLSQQGEGVRAAVGKIPAIQESLAQAPDMFDHLTGATVHELVRPRGQGMGQSPEIARQLREAGIPGIRYLDGGSRGSGQGTSNYVVFDPSIVDILKKYGLAGMTLGGGSMFMGGNQ